MPTLRSVIQTLGWAEIGRIVAGQLRAFAAAALDPRPLLETDFAPRLMVPAYASLAGIAALALHWREKPAFAAIAGVSLVAFVTFVCGVWHYDLRFFLPLVPLLAASLAGGLARAARWGRSARRQRAAAALALAAGLATAGLAFASAARRAQLYAWPAGPTPASACTEWIAHHTRLSDRVLTIDPWHLTWETDRPSVVVPAGGTEAIEKVARRYRTSWLVLSPAPGRPAARSALEKLARDPGSRLRPALAFEGADCAVYRIRPGARPGGRGAGKRRPLAP
jgi:hypothetical protein